MAMTWEGQAPGRGNSHKHVVLPDGGEYVNVSQDQAFQSSVFSSLRDPLNQIV